MSCRVILFTKLQEADLLTNQKLYGPNAVVFSPPHSEQDVVIYVPLHSNPPTMNLDSGDLFMIMIVDRVTEVPLRIPAWNRETSRVIRAYEDTQEILGDPTAFVLGLNAPN